MLPNRPSRTAQGAAIYRAAHQLVDNPLIFDDPLALTIIGGEAETELRSGRDRHAMPQAAGLRAFIAARSRCAEDSFANAFHRGVKQYVSLGAGLDTFAYRNRFEGVQVFEVDHLTMQDLKQERLAQAAIIIPQEVFYAPVDFEHETLRDALAQTQFDFGQLAFFSWLGVTPYLTHDVIKDTLGMVAKMKAGSEIVFDFATPPIDDPRTKAAKEMLAARVKAIGEPMKSMFKPTELAEDLRLLGFSQVEIIDTAVLNKRYFGGREDGLILRGGNMMRAQV